MRHYVIGAIPAFVLGLLFALQHWHEATLFLVALLIATVSFIAGYFARAATPLTPGRQTFTPTPVWMGADSTPPPATLSH